MGGIIILGDDKALYPCPFCGGEAEFMLTSCMTIDNYMNVKYAVHCKKCDARAPDGYGETRFKLNGNGELVAIVDDRQAAIAAWNRRA